MRGSMKRKVDFCGTAEQLAICEQLVVERHAQDQQWGGPDRDDTQSRHEWLAKVEEHATRARKAIGSRQQSIDLDEYRRRLIVMAALCVAAVEAHDRDCKAEPPPHRRSSAR